MLRKSLFVEHATGYVMYAQQKDFYVAMAVNPQQALQFVFEWGIVAIDISHRHHSSHPGHYMEAFSVILSLN
jgi:hypothetical protein